MMNRLHKIALIIIVLAALVTTGCSSTGKGHCGCPNKSGMVGYK